MRRFLTYCWLFLACLSLGAPASAGRERLRMDGNWRFYRGDFESVVTGVPVTEWHWKADDRGEASAAEMADPDMDDSSWEPAAINQDVFGGRTGFAWFRTRLPDVAAKTRRLYFGSVDDDAWVYLNGKLVGTHSGWGEDFEVSLDSAWREGGPNVVAVLVQNSGGGPGGLYRRVLLQADADMIARGPAAPDFDDSTWRRVDLPHDFVVEGTYDPAADRNHGYLPVGVAWYRKEFTLSASDRGRRIWLEFDGVYRASTIWLNGKLLGRHQSGYTSFYFDVTEAANFGGRNVLAVRVDASGFEGWWYEGGGIYRHVWLTKLSPVHVGHWGTYVVSEVPGGDQGRADEAILTITTTVVNDAALPISGELISQVITPSGRTVATVQSPFSLKGLESTDVVQSAHLLKPALWSIETPNLYRLRSTVSVRGRTVDETETTFGIRTIRFDPDQGFFLNGKHVKIKGTCNHHDFAGVGIGLPDRC
ncbi:MAG: beta galactosidase jelly roll domain-containing protein, partial [Armatimonadetes bacterium]|nr:beta galactosidase jelly roll domain-containing protein [Armatimonadota bacterium]